MRYGSVCSGIEAATVAWHPLGWKPAWFSEIEKFPSAALAHHYPDVPNLGDMTTLLERIPEDGKSIDLLVGGTPCQSFSVAGLRKGLADPRGNLALVFLGLLDHLRPRWMVWENVPGVLSSNRGRDFGSFVGGLEKLGYGFAYRILDAQYFGVPQRRRRVFVVGYLGDWRPAAAVLFERQSLSGDPAPRRKTGQGPAPTVSSRASYDRGDGAEPLVATMSGEDLSPSLISRMETATGGTQDAAIIGVAPTLRASHDASEDGSGRGTPIIAFSSKDNGRDAQSDVTPTLRSMNSVNGNQNAGGQLAAVGSFKPGQGAKARGIGYEENLAPTLEAGGGGNAKPAVQAGLQVRRLTPRECERLQGFPDDYTLIPYRGGVRSGRSSLQIFG